MSEGAVGLLVLLTLSVVVALAAHSWSRRYGLASFLSGVVSIVLFLAIVVSRGDADAFIAIAAIVGAGYSIVIALLVGLPFLYLRSRR